jgi:hypothetical protein
LKSGGGDHSAQNISSAPQIIFKLFGGHNMKFFPE